MAPWQQGVRGHGDHRRPHGPADRALPFLATWPPESQQSPARPKALNDLRVLERESRINISHSAKTCVAAHYAPSNNSTWKITYTGQTAA